MPQIMEKIWFFKKIGDKVRDTSYKQMILLGDFNGVIGPLWDRSGTWKINKNSGGKLPRTLFDILEEQEIIDIWRMFNGTSREFTLFSDRHKSHSRIDLTLTSKVLNMLRKKVEILPKIRVDHNPVMWVGKDLNSSYQWRLNEQLLSREEKMKKLREETKNYFKENLDREVSLQNVWDAYKAVMRGVLIKMNYERKMRKKLIDYTEAD